jgi:FkbM family methyltransferase
VFPPINVHKPCRYGTLLFNPNDAYVGRALDLYGEYSQGEVLLFEQVVKAGDFVVEVGANLGAHTVPLARLVGPAGRVFAFEPQRVLFQTLCGNLALNSITNTVARHEAVGTAAGSLAVPSLDYSHPANYGAVALGEEAGWATRGVPTEPVPVVTLDSLALPRCKLLKIDVEGMEAEVLLGGRETVARCRPLLYVENDRPDKSERLVSFVRSLGYTLYWHTPPLFHPDNFAKNPENVYPGVMSINVVGVPAEATALTMSGFTPVTDPVHPVFRRGQTM